MKKHIKIVLISCSLLITLLSNAQPGDDDNNGDLEGSDPIAAPINTQLYIVLFLGIAYTYYKIRKKEYNCITKRKLK